MTAPEPCTVARVTHHDGRVMEGAKWTGAVWRVTLPRDMELYGWPKSQVARVEPLRVVPDGAVVLDPGDDEQMRSLAWEAAGARRQHNTDLAIGRAIVYALAAPPQPDEPTGPLTDAEIQRLGALLRGEQDG